MYINYIAIICKCKLIQYCQLIIKCMWPIVVIARSYYFQNIESATPSRTSTPTAIVPSGVRMCKLWGLKIKEVSF